MLGRACELATTKSRAFRFKLEAMEKVQVPFALQTP
jgi:hypothetical protein